MVKCPRCGYENNSTSRFCVNCTYPIKNSNSKGKLENRSKWERLGAGKKITIVLGIVIIALLLFSLINILTAPDSKSSFNLVTSNQSNGDVPTEPFQVKVIYNGSWSGKFGNVNSPVYHSGSGEKSYRLDAAGWDNVMAEVYKNTVSSDKLTVQIIKNGKVVKENSTTGTQNGVTLEF